MSNDRQSAPSRRHKAAIPLAIAAFVVLTGYFYSRQSRQALAVYCAHDSVYSEAILDDFSERAGIRLAIRFDTEATKSLGLIERLIFERDDPRCDVFWNNEALGTMDLAAQGLLQPYRGPGYERVPERYRDPDGLWAGFAARMRVVIVNTNKLAADPAAIHARLAAPDLSRVAIAKPLYGTTLTHYSVLWERSGADAVKAWHEETRARGLVEAPGNGAVKNLVAAGTCDFGFTDTDDFFMAHDAGKPVAMFPVRLDDGRAIVIPNTVAIVKGARHPEAARRLVDYLLSAECETALANSRSRQIPLGPVDADDLPREVQAMLPWKDRGYPLASLDAARAECLAWLKGESE